MKILKFTAAWCGPCKTVEPILKKFAASHQLEVEHINIDKPGGYEQSEKFNVQGIPTMIFVDDAGKELARVVGAVSAEELEAGYEKARSGKKSSRSATRKRKTNSHKEKKS